MAKKGNIAKQNLNEKEGDPGVQPRGEREAKEVSCAIIVVTFDCDYAESRYDQRNKRIK